MTDERLRGLEQEWRRSGDDAAGVAWLQERLRVGGLTVARAELAAYLNHPLARAVATPRKPQPNNAPVWAWPTYVTLNYSTLLSHQEAVRAAADMVERALDRLGESADGPLRGAVAVTRACLTGVPSKAEALAAARRGASEASRAGGRTNKQRGATTVAFAATALVDAAQAMAEGSDNARHRATEAAADAANAIRMAIDGRVVGAAYAAETAWQDRHLARCLLEPSWPDWRTTS